MLTQQQKIGICQLYKAGITRTKKVVSIKYLSRKYGVSMLEILKTLRNNKIRLKKDDYVLFKKLQKIYDVQIEAKYKKQLNRNLKTISRVINNL